MRADLRTHLSPDRRPERQHPAREERHHAPATTRAAPASISNGTWPVSRPPRIVRCAPATSIATSAPEWAAPTTSTGPSCSCPGFLYSLEWSCTISGSSSPGERRRERAPEGAGGDDHVLGLEAPVVALDDVAAAVPRQSARPGYRRGRAARSARVLLEVVGHLVLGREGPAGRRERHPRQAVEARRAVQPQRVVVPAPVVADASLLVEDHERPAALREVVAGREPGLARADDDRLDALGRGHDAAPAYLPMTTGIVLRSSSVGLNSTISAPA